MIPTGQNYSGKDQKVGLQIKLHEYKFLAQIFIIHKDTLFRLKINNILKKDLITDIKKIENILKKSEIGIVPKGG
jgi:hypothetical protein